MRFLLGALAALCLSGCATRPPIPRDTALASFLLERDLLGQTVARGEFQAITGVRRGFTAHLNGAWDGEVFTLEETFVFDDGERDQKTWRLRRVRQGEYVGTREDVIGQARGFQDGQAFRLEYDVVLTSGNGVSRRVRFRDVLVRTADGDVLNTATVGLWGLRVARVELIITREAAAVAAE